MMSSKFFTTMIILTTIVMIAAVTFQALEMHEFDLFNTLQDRFFN